MESLVGKRFEYKGLKIGHVTVITEPRTGFLLKKNGELKDTKTCLVSCSCGNRYELSLKRITNNYVPKCSNCGKRYGKAYKGRVKSLFEYWMSQWKPETYKPCTFKLPYFKGGVGEEYIAGFCYVNEETYKKCSKVMNIKVKEYMKYILSKDNCNRLAIPYKGNKSGYKFIHRIAINSKTEATDHINGITIDNRPCNLREATMQSNNFNKRKLDSNTTGYTGVVKREVSCPTKPWCAQIMKNKKYISKHFITKEEAVEYRDCLSLHCFGEFAKLNKPELIGYYKDNLYRILEKRHHTWQPFES